MQENDRTAQVLLRLQGLLPHEDIQALQHIATSTGYPLEEVLRRIVDKGLDDAAPNNWAPWPRGRGPQPDPALWTPLAPSPSSA